MTKKEDRILLWLKLNPGFHSPTEIGMKALNKPYNSASASTSHILKNLYRLSMVKMENNKIRYSAI